MDSVTTSIHTLLHDPDPQSRYHAMARLGYHTDRPDVVEALIVALGDGGYYEIPEPGAPSFIYSVYERATELLLPLAAQHFERILAEMQKSSGAFLSGLSLMPRCGPAGIRVVLDALDHPDKDVPPKAATVLSSLLDSGQADPDPYLFEAVVKSLVHPNVFVRSTAISHLKWFFLKRPEIDPVQALPEGFLEVLASAVRQGEVRADSAWPFLPHPLMVDACAHRAALGDDQTAHVLRKHLDHLHESLVGELSHGVFTPGLGQLLGDLGQRAESAIPMLTAALDNPKLEGWAAVALLRIPGGTAHVHDRLTDLFMREESIRSSIARFHPDPPALAAAVIPRLREQWDTIDRACRARGTQAYAIDLAPWRGMEALGALMVSELPWLLTFLEPYGVDKIPRSYAIGIVSTFGEEAREAFPKLARLLDQTDDRGPVLKALIRLGPVAAADFQTMLEVLELESRSWIGWQRNWWRQPIVDALASVRGDAHAD